MNADEMTLQAIIKSLVSRGVSEDELEKSLNTAGLLAKKKEIMVNGKPEFKIYWVNPKNEEKEKAAAQRETQNKQKNAPKEKKPEVEDYEKPQNQKDDEELPDDVKEHINEAHSAKAGKKPLAVVLHGKDDGTHNAVKGELSKHSVKAAHIDPEKLGHHTDKAVAHAANNQKHVVYDASKSSPEHARNAAQKLKEHGYDVHEVGKKK